MNTSHTHCKLDVSSSVHDVRLVDQGRLLDTAELDPALIAVKVRQVQARTIAELLVGLALGLRQMSKLFFKGSRRKRTIANLRSLDDHLLEDIGLRRTDIELAVDGRLNSYQSARPTTPGLDERFLSSARRMPQPANSNKAPDAAA